MPFSTPAPAVARRRHLLAAVTVALAALLVAGAVAGARRPAGGPSPTTSWVPLPSTSTSTTAAPTAFDLLAAVPYSERPAYRGVRWADQLQRDQDEAQLVPSDLTRWKNAGTTRTRFVNVRDGRRRNPPADCPGCRRATVWLVGASAAFGVGQRDVGTVAADLVRRAAADGVGLDVVNLGVPGWTAHQEVEDALSRLRPGGARPDAVVVLDGFNDVTAALAREGLGRGGENAPLVFEENEVQQALSADALSPAQVDRAVARSVRALRLEHGRLADALGPAGVPMFTFFQPDAFASPAQLSAVRSVYEDVPGLLERQELGDALGRTAAALAPGTTDLRGVYDGVGRTVMVDVVHTNEQGASIVADRVYSRLRPTLAGT